MNIIKNQNENRKQCNWYEVIDSCGRVFNGILIGASNIQEATTEARNRNLNFWKVKRCYSGGVRG